MKWCGVSPLAAGALPWIGAAIVLISGCETRRSVAHSVVIKAMRYEPEVLRVAVGDTVRWTNLDLVPHTATSGRAGGFDSGNLPPDSLWAIVVTRPGVLDYSCLYHTGMKGSIVADPRGGRRSRTESMRSETSDSPRINALGRTGRVPRPVSRLPGAAERTA